MQRIAGQIYFSATDLSHFADCQHLTWLDRLNLDEKMDKTPTDEHAKLIQAKGYEHEAAYLRTLRASDVSIVEIPKDASAEKREADYKAAKERCDSLTGAAKDTCQNDAKAKFGMK